MDIPTHAPHLRLVGDDRTPSTELLRPASDVPARMRAGQAQATRAVERENRQAARNVEMDPTDPRWVFAARAYSQLDGAALTADRREKLMKTARQLGIRVFDASVIIAMVQDRARRGESLREVTPTLEMMPVDRGAPAPMNLHLWRWVAAIGSAMFLAWLLMRWVVGG